MEAPQRPLSPVARRIWRLQQIGIWGALCVGGVILAMNLDALGPLPWIVPLVGLGLGTWLIPRLRWSRWRWDVRDEGIDIQHGTLTVRRTLVPWVRVQHVDTRRGVFEQSFGLSTVVVHTAAGGHTIPLLPESEAESLRERIAGLARTDDAEPELVEAAPGPPAAPAAPAPPHAAPAPPHAAPAPPHAAPAPPHAAPADPAPPHADPAPPYAAPAPPHAAPADPAPPHAAPADPAPAHPPAATPSAPPPADPQPTPSRDA